MFISIYIDCVVTGGSLDPGMFHVTPRPCPFSLIHPHQSQCLNNPLIGFNYGVGVSTAIGAMNKL